MIYCRLRHPSILCRGLKARDDEEATKAHSKVAIGRSDAHCGIGDHLGSRGLDWSRRDATGSAVVDAKSLTQRGPELLKRHARHLPRAPASPLGGLGPLILLLSDLRSMRRLLLDASS